MKLWERMITLVTHSYRILGTFPSYTEATLKRKKGPRPETWLYKDWLYEYALTVECGKGKEGWPGTRITENRMTEVDHCQRPALQCPRQKAKDLQALRSHLQGCCYHNIDASCQSSWYKWGAAHPRETACYDAMLTKQLARSIWFFMTAKRLNILIMLTWVSSLCVQFYSSLYINKLAF